MRPTTATRAILSLLLIVFICAFVIGCPEPPTPCVGDTRGGSYLWAKQIGGHSWDRATGVAAFPDGSCIVTGRYGEAAVFACGEANETVVPALGSNDIFIAAYDSEGGLKWVKHARGESYYDGPLVGALNDGTCLVACRLGPSEPLGSEQEDDTLLTIPSDLDPILVKLDADGALLWAACTDGDDFYVHDMSAFANGSSVLVGSVLGTVTFGPGEPEETTLVHENEGAGLFNAADTAFAAKYSHEGILEWVTSARGVPVISFKAASAAEDGSIYVCGHFSGRATFGAGEPNETSFYGTHFTPAGGHHIFVAKYSAEGLLEWAKSPDSRSNDALAGSFNETASDVSAAPDGGCFVTGQLRRGRTIFGAGEPNSTVLIVSGTSPGSLFLARYASDGRLVWVASARASGHLVETLPDGSCIVSGRFRNCARFEAITGEPIAIAQAHREKSSPAAAFHGNEDDTVAASGQEAKSPTPVSRASAFFVKYSKNGTPMWGKYTDGTGSWPRDIAAVPDGAFIAVGSLHHDYAIFGFGETNALRLDVFGSDEADDWWGTSDAFVAKFPPE